MIIILLIKKLITGILISYFGAVVKVNSPSLHEQGSVAAHNQPGLSVGQTDPKILADTNKSPGDNFRTGTGHFIDSSS